MSSQQLVRHAVVTAWIAGVVCATIFWQILMDLKLGPGHGHWLPIPVIWGLQFFTAACLTLAVYFRTRAALNSLNSRG